MLYSVKFCLQALLFILPQIVSFTMGNPSTCVTTCDMKDDPFKKILDLNVDFISKVRQTVVSGFANCVMGEIQNNTIRLDMDIIEKVKEIVSAQSGCQRPIDCEVVLRCGNTKSGVYTIWPENGTVKDGVKVYCDMDTDGGGWTVIQRRGNYGRPVDYFFKDWESYKRGFGYIDKDFWLGNDLIHALSDQKEYAIRFDLRDVKGETRYALYTSFRIESETGLYRLHISGYGGNAGDAMKRNDNQAFSTKDRNNDQWDRNCAQQFKGAWWYKECHDANLNGLYLRGRHESYADGVNWRQWKNYNESLAHAEMKIRSKDFRARR